jgi:hypothetical protein
MHDEHDRLTPSARDLRPLYRPPYGLPLRRRAKLLNESKGFGRRYAAPTPPKKPPLRDGDLRTRAAIVAGFLACAALGIWSSAWGAESVSRGSGTVTGPAPDLSTSGRAVGLPSLPQPKTTLSASPSTTSTPSPEAWKSRKGDRAKGSALPRHRIQRVPMESRRTIATPVDKGRKTKAPKASIKKGSVSVIAAKCDELFPPSRPAFRVRNQACHQIYG